MANIPISQLPQAFSAYPESLLVIVNYNLVPTGQTNYIYYSALTAQFSASTSDLLITDGSTSVTSVSGITFNNSEVTDNGNGNVTISFTGGTVTGETIFTNGLTADTISATTYYNLPLDVYVTGGTYNDGTAIFTNNTGGTFNVNGFYTGATDVYVTGGTFNNSIDTLFLNNSTGGTITITGFTDYYTTGFTFNPATYDLTIERNDGLPNLTTNLSILSSDVTITGGTYNSSTGTATFTNNTGGTFDVSGFLTGFTDIYVTGGTFNKVNETLTLSRNDNNIVNITGFTDVFVTGGTYSNGTATFTNNTGGTFNVFGFSTATGGTSNYYGSFLDTTNQPVSGANISTVWTYNTTELSNGIYIQDNSKIKVSNDGIYEIGYSAQIQRTQGGAPDPVTIWAVINGNPVPRSTSTISLESNSSFILPYVSYIFNLNAGDYVEFYFSSPSEYVRLETLSGLTSPTRPVSPSVIITAKSIGNAVLNNSGDTYVTGFTLNNNVLSLTQNRLGSYSGFSVDLPYINTSGGTLTGNLNINGSLSATTYYGDGSNLTGISRGGGGAGGQIYYFNISNTQSPYYEFSLTPILTSQQSISAIIDGGQTSYIGGFMTPSNTPNITNFPAGILSFYLHCYDGTTNHSFNIYCELYKRTTGGTETLLFTSSSAAVIGNTPSMVIVDGFFSGATLNDSDLLVVKLYGQNITNQTRTIYFVSEGSQNYSFSLTTIPNYTDVFVTGATKSGDVATFTNNTGGTFTLTGLTDTFTTGGTYSDGTAIFTNNTGGTFNVSGFYTGATDVYVTGATKSGDVATFTNNTGGTFTLTGLTDVFVTGGTYNNGSLNFTNNTGGTFSIVTSTNYSAGAISGSEGGWSSTGTGQIRLPKVDVALYNNDNFIEPIIVYEVASGTTNSGGIPTLINNDTNYIVIEYNGGSPRYNVYDNAGLINTSSVVLVYIVYRANNFIHVLEFGNQGAGLPEKLNDRLIATDRFGWQSGLMIGLSGSTGVVTLSEGVAWNGSYQQDLVAVNSQDDVFFKNFHSGGTWTYTTTGNTLNNTFYDDGTNPVNATAGKYLTNYYYRGQEENDHLYEVYSTNEYTTVIEAEAAENPPLPELITSHAFLVGRIIVKVGESTGITQTAFATVFLPSGNVPSSSVHNDLIGLQGGSPGQYYHLNSNQYNYIALTNVDNNFSSGQTINGTLTVSSASTINGPLTVNNSSTVNGDVTVNGSITVSDSYESTDNTIPSNNLITMALLYLANNT